MDKLEIEQMIREKYPVVVAERLLEKWKYLIQAHYGVAFLNQMPAPRPRQR